MVLSHTCGCMKDHRVLEVTVASNLKLGKEWRILKSVPLLAKGSWSEVLIQVPTDDVKWGTDDVMLMDGAPVMFEGWLRASDGEIVALDKVSCQAWGARRTFITLRGSSLRRKGRVFDTLALKVDREVSVLRVLWMSYNPVDFKAGVAEPSDPGEK